MDFAFLYDRQRHLFFIGYNVSAARIDEHHYDLLASEARLDQLPRDRQQRRARRALAASRPPDRAGRRDARAAVVERHDVRVPDAGAAAARGRRDADRPQLSTPRCASRSPTRGATASRGASPSAATTSSTRSRTISTAPSAFPALGLQARPRRRPRHRAVRVAPRAAAGAGRRWSQNLRRLTELGAIGRYGMYEAIDFTASRRTPGRAAAGRCVRSWPITRAWSSRRWTTSFTTTRLVRRFHAEPVSKTAELLLYERPPRRAPVEQPQLERARTPRRARRAASRAVVAAARCAVPAGARPVERALQRRRHRGGRRRQPLARCRADALVARHDARRRRLPHLPPGSGRRPRLDAVSRAPAPSRAAAARCSPPHLVEHHESLRRSDGAPAHPGGPRRRRRDPPPDAQRRGPTARRIAVIGYGEVVLGDAAADRRHPAFSKLFVESEYVRRASTRWCSTAGRARPATARSTSSTRWRCRAAAARPLGLRQRARCIHRARRHGARPGRARRSGPAACRSTDGATLDPVMVLAATIDLPPHRARELAFITAVADSREAALELARALSLARRARVDARARQPACRGRARRARHRRRATCRH